MSTLHFHCIYSHAHTYTCTYMHTHTCARTLIHIGPHIITHQTHMNIHIFILKCKTGLRPTARTVPACRFFAPPRVLVARCSSRSPRSEWFSASICHSRGQAVFWNLPRARRHTHSWGEWGRPINGVLVGAGLALRASPSISCPPQPRPPRPHPSCPLHPAPPPPHGRPALSLPTTASPFQAPPHHGPALSRPPPLGQSRPRPLPPRPPGEALLQGAFLPHRFCHPAAQSARCLILVPCNSCSQIFRRPVTPAPNANVKSEGCPPAFSKNMEAAGDVRRAGWTPTSLVPRSGGAKTRLQHVHKVPCVPCSPLRITPGACVCKPQKPRVRSRQRMAGSGSCSCFPAHSGQGLQGPPSAGVPVPADDAALPALPSGLANPCSTPRTSHVHCPRVSEVAQALGAVGSVTTTELGGQRRPRRE